MLLLAIAPCKIVIRSNNTFSESYHAIPTVRYNFRHSYRGRSILNGALTPIVLLRCNIFFNDRLHHKLRLFEVWPIYDVTPIRQPQIRYTSGEESRFWHASRSHLPSLSKHLAVTRQPQRACQGILFSAEPLSQPTIFTLP